MNAVSTIDKQIASHLTELNTIRKKAVLGVIRAFVVEANKDYENEMNKRFVEMESGAVKGYSLEEATERARNAYRSLQN